MVLAQNPVAPYSRALRIARALVAESFEVEIAATAGDGLADLEHDDGYVIRRYPPAFRNESGPARIDRPRPHGLGRLRHTVSRVLTWPRRVQRALDWPRPVVRQWWLNLDQDLAPADLYHCCGVHTLPPALRARDRAAAAGSNGSAPVVIYDLIDDYFDSVAVASMPRIARLVLRRREGRLARQADLVVTANRGLSAPVAERWDFEHSIEVVDNYPDAPPNPKATRSSDGSDPIREATGLQADTLIVLYQGRLGPGRCLDEAAEAVTGINGAALVLLGFGPWFERMRRRDHDPRFRGRHFTLPAVHPDALWAWTAAADVSLVVLKEGPGNFRLTTPNKLWESAIVGVPVVVNVASTVMSDLVQRYALGTVSRSSKPADIRAALQEVLAMPKVEAAARRASIRDLALREFSWPAAEVRYRQLVRNALAGAAGDPAEETLYRRPL